MDFGEKCIQQEKSIQIHMINMASIDLVICEIAFEIVRLLRRKTKTRCGRLRS